MISVKEAMRKIANDKELKEQFKPGCIIGGWA